MKNVFYCTRKAVEKKKKANLNLFSDKNSLHIYWGSILHIHPTGSSFAAPKYSGDPLSKALTFFL